MSVKSEIARDHQDQVALTRDLVLAGTNDSSFCVCVPEITRDERGGGESGFWLKGFGEA